MLCQNCKINDSTIHLYTNHNGYQKQIDLCQNCYKIIKTDPNNTLFKGMTDLNNRDFDTILLLSLLLNQVEAMVATVAMVLKTVVQLKLHPQAKKKAF